MATLTVGAGQKYTTIQSAVAASASGDTIDVMAGTYTNDFLTITHNLTVQGVGGAVNLVATVQPPNGKAIIDEGGAGITVNLTGLTLSGATVPDGNGAGVRYEGGLLVMANDTVAGNQDGLLGAPDPAGAITITNSTFTNNGSGTGSTHNIYVGAIHQFTITNSTISNAVVGHDIKSRAAYNVITGNTITDGTIGTASYEIDLPNGGNAVISNNTIEKGVNAQNPIAISYGEEGGTYTSNSLSITGNTMVNDYTAHISYALRNSLATTATVSGNSFYGWQNLSTGAATLSNNKTLTSEPALTSPTHVTDPLFDPVYYLEENPDVAASGIDPYVHYEAFGWHEGRNPSALFDTKYYLSNAPDVKAANVDPLAHFETFGWHEGRNPDALFDVKYYLSHNPDVAAAGVDPLVHYDTYGWKEGRNPSASFNTNAYLTANPDIKAAKVDPLAEYLSAGKAEGRAIYAVT